MSRRSAVLLLLPFLCSLPASPSLATGPNAGGTLVLHAVVPPSFTNEGQDLCGQSGLSDCASALTRVDTAAPVLGHVIAAFPPGSVPRLAGVTFGIDYDPCLAFVAWGACGDFELATPTWPNPGSGTAITWSTAQTAGLVEVYWFALYAEEDQACRLELILHPTQGGSFADDDVPSTLDPIAGFGALGFYTAGTLPCPTPLGACCLETCEEGTLCYEMTADVCYEAGGDFLGEFVACDPDPCPQPALGACCYENGTCRLQGEQQCGLCGGIYGGDGTGCDPNPCPQPALGACCLTDGRCFVLPPEVCDEIGGDYQGDGASCDPDPCRGACCFSDGSCTFTTPEHCAQAGGDPQGEGSDCSPNPCPQPPRGACCFENGSCSLLTPEDCAQAHGSYQGDDTSCDPNPCPQPIRGACCDSEGNCVYVTPAECDSLGGAYQGDDTTCDPNPCPQPIRGACCYLDGRCFVYTEELCDLVEGSYQGDDTGCDPNPCPQPPLGACCIFDGECILLDPYECYQAGGAYQGEDTDCDPNPCPQPIGACCFPDDTCLVLPRPDCLASGGEFQGQNVPCAPNPCVEPPGACCFPDHTCLVLSRTDCENAGGRFEGENIPCVPDPCAPPPPGEHLCPRPIPIEERAEIQRRAEELWRERGDPSPVAEAGPGHGRAAGDPAGGCGTPVFNADGTYENGYAWQYGGVTAPYYGSFAEFYTGQLEVCSVLFDLTQVGNDSGQTMDLFVWESHNGGPGRVLGMAFDVDPGPIAFWPFLSRHVVSIWADCPVDDAFFVGYWGAWPGQLAAWYVGADLDGFGGCPVTLIAPGIGYPTGWQSVSVVWGPTQALGIGAEVRDCGATPVRESSWGRIKALFR